MGKRKVQKSVAQDAFAFDASQFGDTIKSPEIKPMKKKVDIIIIKYVRSLIKGLVLTSHVITTIII